MNKSSLSAVLATSRCCPTTAFHVSVTLFVRKRPKDIEVDSEWHSTEALGHGELNGGDVTLDGLTMRCTVPPARPLIVSPAVFCVSDCLCRRYGTPAPLVRALVFFY